MTGLFENMGSLYHLDPMFNSILTRGELKGSETVLL